MIELESAIDHCLSAVAPLAPEAVSLHAALGRTLAQPVQATHTQPPNRRSRMDGIAIRDAAPADGRHYTLVGENRAGIAAVETLSEGDAIRVATGGVVPDDATHVVPQEEVAVDGDTATLTATPGGNSFIRESGSDFHAGDTLLDAGRRIGAAQVGVVAAANVAIVQVTRRPRVKILAGGDELVAVGDALAASGAVDSASPMLAALLTEWGADAAVTPLMADERDAVEAALGAACGDADLVVTIGGASVGARDHLRPAARAIGGDLVFEKIAVKPGKPCWLATGAGAPILGLPGNPGSAFVTAHLLLLPMVEAMLGRPESERRMKARLEGTLSTGPRRTFFHATLAFSPDGVRATPLRAQDSGLQSPFAVAQALIDMPADTQACDGDTVDVLRL